MTFARYPELHGRVAVVTGAAKGIGAGIAMRLAAEGMNVVAADIDAEALASTADALRGSGSGVLAHLGDVTVRADIDQLFDAAMETFGAVDVLVNNAAHLGRKRTLDEHDELLDLQLATNIRGPYLCSQRAAGIMRDAGQGSIVNISSVGALRAHHRGLPYDVTKGAINAMTMAMAVDLGMYGIRVNAVGPGVTTTHRSNLDVASVEATSAGIPLRRYGSIADIAASVAFLASDEAGYITGQVIYVDGGITAQLSPEGQHALERDDSHRLPPLPEPEGPR